MWLQSLLNYPAHFPQPQFLLLSHSHTGLFQPLKYVMFFPVSWSLHILFHPAHPSSQCQSFRAQLKLCFLKEAFLDYLGPLSYAHMASECCLHGTPQTHGLRNHLYHHSVSSFKVCYRTQVQLLIPQKIQN